MISVHASEADHPVVREFFELFKTPWEFYRPASPAEVLLCAQNEIPPNSARLVLHYRPAAGGPPRAPKILLHQKIPLPFYASNDPSSDQATPLFQKEDRGGQAVVHIACDLFAEIRHLLTIGQPLEHAAIPTLEYHAGLLRQLILDHGLALVEIPPRPAGHKFIACLTHDVDHVGIRNHKFDHTMFGFVFRGTLGSLWDTAFGKKTFGQLAQNWFAVLKLPLVHLGLAKDFWYQFDHYVTLENGVPSTFFVIPKKGETGLDANGNRPAKRAASYDARDLRDILRGLKARGKEVGTHGLDAWRDAAAGRQEKEIISELTGAAESGVRMHWLYFDGQSPGELEQAGFTYDSTCGYNATVGYRAGTTQVFKPLTTTKLLELPLHVMDTALFYPSYLNLSPKQAEEKIRPLIDDAAHFGGALTVNWHDRSLAPERFWDGTYRWLLDEFKAQGAWFATASQTVGWFQKRRAAGFDSAAAGQLKIKSGGDIAGLPALRVRIFEPNAGAGKFIEKLLGDGEEICLAV